METERRYMVKSDVRRLALFSTEEEAREYYDSLVKEEPTYNHSVQKMHFANIGGIKYPAHEIIIANVPEVLCYDRHKAVVKLDARTGKRIGEYASVADAAKAIGKSTRCIYRTIHGFNKTAGGFGWKFKSEWQGE